MSELPGGWSALGGFGAFFLAGFLVSEPWRWAGALLGRNVDATSEVFAWVRAVSTAIIAGLCSRMLLFPAGALAGVGLELRLAAVACGIAAYLALGRRLGIGIAAGFLALFAGQLFGALAP